MQDKMKNSEDSKMNGDINETKDAFAKANESLTEKKPKKEDK